MARQDLDSTASVDEKQSAEIRSAKKTGPIIVSRHGRPALDRTAGPRLDWRQYKDWWARYEIGSLAEGQQAPEILKQAVINSDVVLASSRARALETAQKAAPWADIQTNDLFWEADLPPPRWNGVKMLPKNWNIVARTAWLAGHRIDGEGVRDAEKRADAAADYLIKRAEEGQVYLAAHGWFNRMLKSRLRARKWTCIRDGGDSYWAHRIYVKAE